MNGIAARAGEEASVRSSHQAVHVSASPPMDEAKSTVRLISGQPDASAQRIVVYTANYRIVVGDVDAAVGRLKAMATEMGGYLQELVNTSITIRVPAARYGEAIGQVEGMGQVSWRSQQATDVSDQYVDLEARLRNARAVRERLQGLLAKAEDVKAALEVEKELNRVGEEIERLEGQLEALKNKVAFSTITVELERVARTSPSPQVMQLPFEWLRELDPARLTRNY